MMTFEQLPYTGTRRIVMTVRRRAVTRRVRPFGWPDRHVRYLRVTRADGRSLTMAVAASMPPEQWTVSAQFLFEMEDQCEVDKWQKYMA